MPHIDHHNSMIDGAGRGGAGRGGVGQWVRRTS